MRNPSQFAQTAGEGVNVRSKAKQQLRSAAIAGARSVLEGLESRRMLSTVTVTGTGDTVAVDGIVTLREAIESTNFDTDTNADVTASRVGAYTSGVGEVDTIKFNIAGSGVHTIQPGTDFDIVGPLAIDGYSQTGATANTLAVGDNATLLIEIDGSTGAAANGLVYAATANGSSVRGLIINQFRGSGIGSFSLAGQGPKDLTIAGNFLGTDATGLIARANGNAITLAEVSTSLIGGTTSADRNVISGNTNSGIEIRGNNGGGIAISGNYIGVDATGIAALKNGEDGIVVRTKNVTVGGLAAGAGNVISGNNENGINFEAGSGDVSGGLVQGNFIGVDATGTVAVKNERNGVRLSAMFGGSALPTKVTVGGTAAGARNIISGNKFDGISMSSADENLIQGNYIGTDVTGTIAIGNTSGIRASFSNDAVIGGSSPAARNVISGNTSDGIALELGSDRALIQGNYIGTNAAGTAALGNGENGIVLTRANDTTIGGLVAGTGNVISGNLKSGILLVGSIGGPRHTLIYGNIIGADYTGTLDVGNRENGVIATDGARNEILIGGTISQARNIIAFNEKAGVAIDDTSELTKVTIRQNSIFSNGGLGIDLQDHNVGGVDSNDPMDIDTGANGKQNYPVLTSAETSGSTLTISGIINTESYKPYVLDFFASSDVDPSGSGEGKRFLGSIAVITDGSGNAAFSAVFTALLGTDKYITSTATTADDAPYGNTSEFSQAIESTSTLPPAPPPSVSIGDVSKNEGNSGTTSFTFTLTRTGDLTHASTVSITTANGTGSAGSDYTAQSGTPVTFAAGANTATVTIAVKGDTTVEATETFFVNVAAVANATIGDGQGTGTIVNDDSPPATPKFQFSDATYCVNENGVKATITVTRTSGVGAASVHYATSNGTATAGSDYAAASGVLSFANGQTSKTFSINIINDTKQEPLYETVNLTLSSPVGAGLGSLFQSVLKIKDDECRVIGTGKSNLLAKYKSFSGVVASFISADFNAANKFAASIGWGDGKFSAGSIAWNNTTKMWDVSGSHAYASTGNYTLKIITDANGESATVYSKLKA